MLEFVLNNVSVAVVLAVSGLAATVLVTFIQVRAKRQLIQKETQSAISQVLDLITGEVTERENLLPGQVNADVFILDKNREAIRHVVSSRKNKELKGKVLQYQRGEGVIGKILAQQHSEVIDFSVLDQENSLPFRLTTQEKELFKDMKSLLATPIFHPKANEAVGVLLVYSKDEKLDSLISQLGNGEVTSSVNLISRMLNYAYTLPA
jgi:hypothetical protein